MSPGQRTRRPVALPGHGHERSDAVRRLFFDRLVLGLRGPRERGHGTPIARHRLRVYASQRHFLGERPGRVVAVPRQQQPQPGVQRVRVATPLAQRSTRFHRSTLVVCKVRKTRNDQIFYSILSIPTTTNVAKNGKKIFECTKQNSVSMQIIKKYK